MSASAEVQEELENIEASIGDLVPPPKAKEKKMVGRSWDFGPSHMTAEAIRALEEEGCFAAGKARVPPRGETVLNPEPNEAVVFKDFFYCGLRIPSIYFLHLVLETFKLQLHHLTPNGILTLSKFCYACETYSSPPDLDTFCAYYELQRQPKWGKVDGIEVEFQYGSCAFMAKRSQKDGGLEISYAQKNKWEKNWTKFWFHVETPGFTPRAEPRVRKFPYASTMGDMKPCCRVRPPSTVDAARAACDARDLIEEMVLSKFWPLGKYRLEMSLVKMKLPVFGSEEGEFVPCFKLCRSEDETDEEFVKAIEKGATMLLGEISDKEYLSRRAIGGTMSRLNRVFEEMKVQYGEWKVPDKVIRSIEAKAAKAASATAAQQATVQAES